MTSTSSTVGGSSIHQQDDEELRLHITQSWASIVAAHTELRRRGSILIMHVDDEIDGCVTDHYTLPDITWNWSDVRLGAPK